MKFGYAISSLSSLRNQLEDRIFEVDNGELDHHAEELREKFRKSLIDRSTELSRAIEVLKNI